MLVLFGGIENVTHEKDDVFVFDTRNLNWRMIEGTQMSIHKDVLSESLYKNTEYVVPSRKTSEVKASPLKHKRMTTTKTQYSETLKSP